MIRNTLRLTSRKYRDELKRDVRPIYAAVKVGAAEAALDGQPTAEEPHDAVEWAA